MKKILGHIDCPTCAQPNGMRITPDKNGDPFGFCEHCGQQMRIGGNAGRVAKFLNRFSWASVSVADTDPQEAPAAAPIPVTVTVPEKPPEAPPARRSSLADALTVLGAIGGKA